MSRPIIVGYDPRRLDRSPVAFGLDIAGILAAPVVVASVEATALSLLQGAGQVDEDLVADCSATVEKLEAELASEEVDVECRAVKSTSAARALVELAVAEDAALLVVGSSRESTLDRVLAGTTAVRIMHGAPCPVVIVPPGFAAGSGPRTIGVGYVESEEGRAALRAAHALARHAEAGLRPITVVQVTLRMHAEREAATVEQRGKTLEDVIGEHRLWAERQLRAAVETLGAEVPVQAEAVVGDPAETLVRISEHLDLLVCGSRRYGPLRAVLLGSVSRRVAAEARCPVMVVPRGTTSAIEAIAAAAATEATQSGPA